MKNNYALVCILVCLFLFCKADLLAKTQKATISSANSAAVMQGAPLAFIENAGQIRDQFGGARSDIQFQLKTGLGLNIFIGSGAVHYQFCRPKSSLSAQTQNHLPHEAGREARTADTQDMYRMDVELIGANKNATLFAEQKQSYRENYFTHVTGEKGATALSYNRIVYKDIYPKIDWVLYTNGGKLKHEFIVHEGGNVRDIKLGYAGATALQIDGEGNLIAVTPQGSITEHAPVSFQKDGKKVHSRYVLDGAMLRYETGEYTGELIIDPHLFWATYYGGNMQEYPYGTAADGSGNVYISGYTYSASAIATVGAHQTIFAGGGIDAYLAKFSGTGAIQWATYYGGDDQDYGYGVATDGSGNVYLVGTTYSDSTIATSTGFDTTMNSTIDAFLVKFNSAGIRQWGTYFGGSNSDDGHGVTVDASGDVYIVGRTSSPSGLATSGAHQTVFAGGVVSVSDGFLAKFTSAGARLWATYYGGSNDDRIQEVTTDAMGNVYVTGYTVSGTGIATSGGYQPTFGGGPDDAFLAKFSSTGVRQWATYYGGSFNDQAHSVATDASGNVYITGHTASLSAIATPGAHQTVFAGGTYDAFIVKFSSAGARLWGTYYGGNQEEYGYGIVADGSGNVFLAGYTRSNTGVSTPGTHQPIFFGAWDGYLAKFNGSGVRQWCTYFGGSSYDYASDICIDGTNGVFITGHTESSLGGIATTGAYQTTYGGNRDAFLAKFDGSFVGPVTGAITGTATLCVGATTTLSSSTAGGTWTSGTTSIATVGSVSGIVTGVASGTATISYTATTGTVTIVVTVVALPAPITGSTFVVCTGNNITLASATSGGVWSSSSTATAVIGAGTGIVTGMATGTATITYTYSGCFVTATVTVLALPSAVISGSSLVCVGYTLPLTGATPGGIWSSSNPAAGSVDAVTGIVYGISAGTTTIKYKVSNTCGTDSTTQLVTVVAASSCMLGMITANSETAILKIYPNPSHGIFTIEVVSPYKEKINFIVTNIVGETVKEFTGRSGYSTKISIDQPPGIYFIKTVSGGTSYVGKLIIQ